MGSAFITLCVLGILAGAFPLKCSKMFHFKRRRQEESTRKSSGMAENESTLRGHHPNCGYFGAHVFRIGNRVFCAGCVGLILGAVFSLFGAILYFFMVLSFSLDNLVFWVGFIGVSGGLLQYHLFNWGRSSLHLTVNAFFVFSVFLLLAAIDSATQNVIAGLYIVALSVLWLYTRIVLSQIDHQKICSACTTELCYFFEKDTASQQSAYKSANTR